MTNPSERITPDEVRQIANHLPNSWCREAEKLDRLADQMEADRDALVATQVDYHTAKVEAEDFTAERDTLAAKVAEYEERTKGPDDALGGK